MNNRLRKSLLHQCPCVLHGLGGWVRGWSIAPPPIWTFFFRVGKTLVGGSGNPNPPPPSQPPPPFRVDKHIPGPSLQAIISPGVPMWWTLIASYVVALNWHHYSCHPVCQAVAVPCTGDCAPRRGPYGVLCKTAQRGSVSAPGIFFFFTITHPCLFLPPPPQTIWSTFLLCLRIWPILCTQFLTMARVVVGSGGSDILCC